MPLQISQLFLYPVKSLRGFAVERAEVDSLGLVGDRRFLVVDPAGGFLTQRTVPRMATVQTAIEDGVLALSAEGITPLRVPLAATAEPAPALRPVTIWQSTHLPAEDCGELAAAWLTEALDTPARLMRAGPGFRRLVPEAKLPPALRAGPDRAILGSLEHRLAFPDAYPFMFLGDATVAELNGRLKAEGLPGVPIERFRPSFVVAGAQAFAEDRWKRFRIGGVSFSGGGPCARCIVTNTDPWTGVRGVEPLRLLSTYRRDPAAPTKVNFGQNALHENHHGYFQLGDPVMVLESEA